MRYTRRRQHSYSLLVLKTAQVIGAENLQKPIMRLYIDEALKQKENARIASADEVLELLTQMARGDV